MPLFFVLRESITYSHFFNGRGVLTFTARPDDVDVFTEWALNAGASARFFSASLPAGDYAAALRSGVIDFVATSSREEARTTAAKHADLAFIDQDGNALSKEQLDAWVVDPDIAGGIAAAYAILLDGVPNKGGFVSLIDTAVSTNFGAGSGSTFNAENMFINLTNNLVQGNPTAKTAFNAVASGATLAEKIASIYKTIIPVSEQTAEGLAFITRPEGIAFYQQVASERGVAGDDGAAIIALASLLKIAVDQDIGIGNAVNDLLKAIAAGSDQLPASGSVFTDIEVADGTQFDGDDAPTGARSLVLEGDNIHLVGMPIADDSTFVL
tara:strand:- start:3319 stop:4293 length:975 start_codon:yes stop_codon:yes gene_type:complete